MAEDMVKVAAPELKKMVIRRLTEVGMPEGDAQVVADVLVFADSRGTHSHGVLRVEHYANRVRQGGMNLKPELKLTRLKPAVGMVDANGGVGHVASRFAAEEVIKMAKEHGLAIVGVKNSSHCGALAYYANMALEHKLASMVCVNTDSAVVPFGGKRPFFGTNPFAFGYPGERQSILLDMATSEVAFGKIFYAREKNTSIPEGWAVDANGNPTTDANAAAALFPFGGAKGYGINMMVEALTGLMIGGVFGPHVKPMYSGLDTYRNLSGFQLVIDPSVYGDGNAFLKNTQAMIDEIHAQSAAPGFERVMIPGEIEEREAERSAKEGISIPKGIHDYLAG